MVSFSFSHGFHELVLISTHSYLSYIDIAIGDSHHAEVLLLRAFAGSSELSDSCSRGSFRGLTASVGVNFGIEDEDVDVVVGSEDVVNTAVTDIVRSTVTTDDPLAAFHQILSQALQLFADRATCCDTLFDDCFDLRSQFFGLICIVHVFDPCFQYFLSFCRSIVGCQDFVEQLHDTCTHLFVSEFHT